MPDYESVVEAGIREALRELALLLPADEAQALASRLQSYERSQLELVLRNHRHKGRVEVLREILRQATAQETGDLPQALAAAERAVAATRSFFAEPRLRALTADLQAEALSLQANVHRRADHFATSERMFHSALVCAEAGSGDPLLFAGICRRYAALKAERHDFTGALRLLAKALACYETTGETSQAAGILLRLGRVAYLSDDAVRSANYFAGALRRFDPREDVQLKLFALHGLAHCLEDLGQPLQALLLLRSHDEVFHLHAPPLLARPHRWLTARLFLACSTDRDAMGQAVQLLEGVRQEFLSENLLLDAALCSLDLALAYARRNEFLPQSRLAEEMIPVFTSLAIEREAVAAFLLYADAARKFRASAALVEEVRRNTEALRRSGPVKKQSPEAGLET